MRKLTVVVTCTERKCLPPAPGLRIRDLPQDASLPVRAKEWRHRIGKASASTPLDKLYQGDAWTQVRVLAATAARKGFDPRVLVASAGLGLRDVTSHAPSYAATFSRRHNDTVAADRQDDLSWWQALHEAPDVVDLADSADSKVLLVLSAPYAAAMQTDLERLADECRDSLLVGGAADLQGMPRLAADKALRTTLGGTATSLNLRTANAWLDRLDEPRLYSRSARDAWESWARRVRVRESFGRQPLSDLDVARFILRVRAETPVISQTAALRRLRDDGYACEQARFGELYQQVVDGR